MTNPTVSPNALAIMLDAELATQMVSPAGLAARAPTIVTASQQVIPPNKPART